MSHQIVGGTCTNNVAVYQSVSKQDHYARKKASIDHLYLSTHEKQWHVAQLFQERLNSLNNLVMRRESLIHNKVLGNECFNDNSMNNNCLNHESKGNTSSHDNNQYDKLGCPHRLSERDPDLPFTDASKRLSLRFEDVQDENNIDKRRTRKARKQGSSRIFVHGRQGRNIEKQLENNSSKYLSRAANSIRFRMKKIPHVNDSKEMQQTVVDEEFPIGLGGYEMNPDLLLRLSCEKVALDQGRGLMKLVSSNPISLDLYVYMYWFIHCRFFQKHSSSEQRYLLRKVSGVFPRFIELLKSMAPPKQRDALFRNYPFVLSKAIYLGFQYLCPGNQSLFKGPFLRILYLSVFRLLTGVDICPESVDAIRFKLYPDDALMDDAGSDEELDNGKIHPLSIGRNRDHLSHSWGQGRHRCTTQTSKRSGEDSCSEEPKRDKNDNNNNGNQKYSIIKHMDATQSTPTSQKEIAKTISSPKRYKCLPSITPKLQQVNFDVNQISPLLQQCLGRECISLRPKQFIKRIEPVRNNCGSIRTSEDTDDDDCDSGVDIHVKTFGYHMGPRNGDVDGCAEEDNDDCSRKEDLMQRHAELKKEMKTALLQNEMEFQKAMSAVAKEKAMVLKTKEAKEEMVAKIMIEMGRQRQRHR